MFIDSHCHLTSEQLAPQFADAIERAQESKVTTLINIGDNYKSSIQAIEQAEKPSPGIDIWATVGIHPQSALTYSFDDTTEELRQLAENPKVVAIGEIGLDYVYDETHAQYPGAPRPLQERVLRAQLDLAIELSLPVVIHNREADEDLLRIVGDYHGELQGVFHCFGSSREVAQRVLDLGFYLGFTGLVTFKNAESVRDVARQCPLDRLLIETDSPYLAPVPYRGKTNEPSFLPKVAETIAGLHGKTIEEIAEITTANTAKLFRLS